MAEGQWYGDHRIHIVETIINSTEGKATILALCLQCGKGFANDHQISKPGSSISRLEKEKTT